MDKRLPDLVECHFCWSGWKGSVTEFIAEVKQQSATNNNAAILNDVNHGKTLITKRKSPWTLPVVVIITEGFDSGGEQRLITTGDILMVIALQAQKRVKLLTQTDKVVTLPHSTRLAFYQDGRSHSKPHSLQNLVRKKIAVEEELVLRVACGLESKDVSDQSLCGPLTFSECYEEIFLICIPIRNKNQQDLPEANVFTIPAYYPVKLATARSLVDLNGCDRLEELYELLISSVGSKIPCCLNIFEELTVSPLPCEIYEPIDGSINTSDNSESDLAEQNGKPCLVRVDASACDSKVADFDISNDGLNEANQKQGQPMTSTQQKVVRLNSNTEALDFPLKRNISQESASEGFATFSRYNHSRHNVRKHDLYTRMPKKTINTHNQFGSVPRNIGKSNFFDDHRNLSKDSEGRKNNGETQQQSSEESIQLTNLSNERRVLERCEDDPSRLIRVNPIHKKNLKPDTTFKAQVDRNHDNSKSGNAKPGEKSRNTILSQIFGFVTKSMSVKDGSRKKKSLSYALTPEHHGNYRCGIPKYHDFTVTAGENIRTSNEYDTINLPLVEDELPQFSDEVIKVLKNGKAEVSSRRPFSRSLDNIDKIQVNALTCRESDSERREVHLKSKSGQSIHPSRDDWTFKARNVAKRSNQEYDENVGMPLKLSMPIHDNNYDGYEEIFMQDKLGDGYIDMGSTYITSDRSECGSIRSASSSTKWTSLDQVPKDLSGLLVSDVSSCLELLNLGQHTKKFAEEQIDGSLLCSLNGEILQNDLRLTKLEALKLMKFVNDGWRPR